MADETQSTPESLEKEEMDPKKAEGESKEGVATMRSCFMKLRNTLLTEITKASLSHTSRDRVTTINAATLKSDASTEEVSINYETGWVWANDTWNISFTMNGLRYATPYNDRCNIYAEDAGGTVTCEVVNDDNELKLKVIMPKSSGCSFIIKPA